MLKRWSARLGAPLAVGLAVWLGSTASCDDDEPTPTCGNGQLENGEACDDGNQVDGDGCSALCELEPINCPDDMVPVEADPAEGVDNPFCIDIWEASRSDATEANPGTATDIALSRAGIMPWYERPVDPGVVDVFRAACQAADKRLCLREEWISVCSGPDQTTYVWGDTFDPEICNCVDTWCDEYCADHPEIPDCPTGDGCGYTTFSMRLMPTGQFPGCVSAHGAFDVCGNLWEVVDAPTSALGYEIKGGAFNCAGPDTRLQCSYNATWSDLYAGFRCCKDLDPS